MIKLEVSTHSGDVDTVEVESYNAIEMAEQINNQEIHAIALGKNVYSRIDLKNIKVLEVIEEDEPTENHPVENAE